MRGVSAVEAVQADFKRWHDLQLNIAEYTPTFAIFMLYIGLRQRIRHKADSEQSGGTATLAPLQRVACWAATASQLSFCAGETDPSHPRPLRPLSQTINHDSNKRGMSLARKVRYTWRIAPSTP